MSLKTKRLDQGGTEMFILEFKLEESLSNAMLKIYRIRNAKMRKKQVSKN